jgi:UDP-N-acetylmuramoyl-tripeptide--D-alanyl-D-alanine ligase
VLKLKRRPRGRHQPSGNAGRDADLVIVVGAGAGGLAEGARDAGLASGRVLHVGDPAAALEALRPRLRDGDVVLVKASRGIGLDHLVDALRDERGPERPS